VRERERESKRGFVFYLWVFRIINFYLWEFQILRSLNFDLFYNVFSVSFYFSPICNHRLFDFKDDH
jgi:hypothetical protein